MGATTLLEVLACPECRSPVFMKSDAIECRGPRQHRWGVAGGVPIMVPAASLEVVHEREVEVREGYVSVVSQVIDALSPDQIVLDLGAGRRETENASVIRADITLTPLVDVVADAHRLPFRDESIDFILAFAVFEHLRKPFVAAQEIMRVLKPGGHVYAECAFVYPFHGYPAMYFNASLEGMRSLFEGLDEEIAAVAEWQMPSFAVEALLAEYLRFFKPATPLEREFVDALRGLDRFPIHEFDRRFDQADAARIAAAVSYVGMKPLAAGQHLIPKEVLKAWKADAGLQRRYPNPNRLIEQIEEGSVVDSLMRWARSTGSHGYPEIAACFARSRSFSRALPRPPAE